MNAIRYCRKTNRRNRIREFNLNDYEVYHSTLPRFTYSNFSQIYGLLTLSYMRGIPVTSGRLYLMRGSTNLFLTILQYTLSSSRINRYYTIREYNTLQRVFSKLGFGSKTMIGAKLRFFKNYKFSVRRNLAKYKRQNHYSNRILKYRLYPITRVIFKLSTVLRIKQQLTLHTKLSNMSDIVGFCPFNIARTTSVLVSVCDNISDAVYKYITFIRTSKLSYYIRHKPLYLCNLHDFMFIDVMHSDINLTNMLMVVNLNNIDILGNIKGIVHNVFELPLIKLYYY